MNRLLFFKRKYYDSSPDLTPEQVVQVLAGVVRRHLRGNDENYNHLYRVFYYDAPPLDVKAHYPLLEKGETNRRAVDFSKKPENIHRHKILDVLKKQRKYALRLGTIKHDKQWKLADHALNQLISGEKEFKDLSNDDFYYNTRQKGVDIKLGVDVSTLAQNSLVDRIVLVAGDSDFVPAAKLARTSGIDFVLDALRNNIDPSLHEHIDGLISYDLVSILKEVLQQSPDTTPTWWSDGSDPQKPKQRRGRRGSR